MQQEIQLNIIPFKAQVEEADFAFYTAKHDVYLPDRQSYWPIHKYDLNRAIEGLVDNKTSMINHLIDQVYKFSRLYWKSVSQQNLPVIIKCSEMVAEIFPYYTHDKLPGHSKGSLWFL